MTFPARSLLSLLALAALLAVLALGVGGGAPAEGQAGLASERAAAARLREVVEAERRRIGVTRAGLADAERRLAILVARAQQRQAQLDATQDRLVRARVRLTGLERKEARSTRTLADNLVAAYRAGEPDYVTVVMSSRGFADLLERVEFLKRVSRRNANILDDTREARRAVARQADELKRMRTRYSVLAREAMADRDRVDVVRTALLRREEQQLRRRDGAAARLATVRARIGALERRAAEAARRARAAASAAEAAPRASAPSSSGGGGGGSAPSGGGGDVVARVVAAASQIATTPYVWGGGHGGASGGYDCSGSISYALAAGGLLSSPLDSTGFMSWGDAGPGRRITVYANAGHAFMVVDGRRYDTSALSGGGTRWTSASRSTAGFVARHPPGL
jgi:cell wall-associated NlpC family hydrolase